MLDADARVAPGFLRSLARQMAGGTVALSCPIALNGAPRRALARLQASEQRLDLAIQRGRFGLGGCSEFRGNGIVIRREALVARAPPAGPHIRTMAGASFALVQ